MQPLDRKQLAGQTSVVDAAAARAGRRLVNRSHVPYDGMLVLRCWLQPATRWPLRHRRLRQADVEATITDEQAPMRGGTGRVANLMYLDIPMSLRRRGIATRIVTGLTAQWSAAGVVEVHATQGSHEGMAALAAWGFKPLDGAGHLSRWWKPLE